MIGLLDADRLELISRSLPQSGNVAYLVCDLGGDPLRERDKFASPRMVRLIEETGCGPGENGG